MTEDTKKALKLLEEAFAKSENAEIAFRVAASEFSSPSRQTPKRSKRIKCCECEYFTAMSRISEHETILWCDKTRSKIVSQNFDNALKLLGKGCLKSNAKHVEMYSTVSRMR